MKVVYNNCRGGFGLSEAACMLLAKRQGFDTTGWIHSDSYLFNHNVVGRYPRSIERHDPDLVHVVEKLGDEANGEYAELSIIEIPDGARYDIFEIKGKESVSLSTINNEIEKELINLKLAMYLASLDVVFLLPNKPKNSDDFVVAINCNDTFVYACADAEEIGLEYMPTLLELYNKFSWSGVVALAAKLRLATPLKAYLDSDYYKAVDYIENLKLEKDKAV